MNDEQFVEWCDSLNIDNTQLAIIERIRKSPPSRNVGGGKRNAWGKYASPKMKWHTQFESGTVERPAVYMMEHDNQVLEYYDQPGEIKIRYKSQNEKVLSPFHTPDFFVIRADGAGWEEWKREEDLIALSIESPNRYQKDQNGIWRCPPGEEYAKKYGFYYKLRSSAEIKWTLQRNIRFLEDYIRDDKYLENYIETDLADFIKENQGCILSELIDSGSIPVMLKEGL